MSPRPPQEPGIAPIGVRRFDYDRDDDRRRIHIVAHGQLQPDDAVVIVGRQIADGAWTYGVLYDLRRMPGTIPWGGSTYGDYVRRFVAVYGRRGPVAVVASPPTRATMEWYASRAAGYDVGVFDDVLDAERWLERRASS